jgi:hypothetical protein
VISIPAGRGVMEYIAGALVQLLGVFLGFICGYGVRELISRQRQAASDRRRLARRVEAITGENPRHPRWQDRGDPD